MAGCRRILGGAPSGASVAESLRCQGYTVTELDVAAPLFDQEIHRADVAFLTVAGQYAQDGKLQGMLELLGVPYTGSGVLASALAMHLPTAKKLLRRTHARPVAPWLRCTETVPVRPAEAFAADWTNRILAVLKPPVVLKAASQGSLLAPHVAHAEPELRALLTRLAPAQGVAHELLIEPYLAGRHLSVGVLDASGELVGLPPLEIEPPDEPDSQRLVQTRTHPPPRSCSRGTAQTSMAAAAGLDFETLIARILHTAARIDGYRP